MFPDRQHEKKLEMSPSPEQVAQMLDERIEYRFNDTTLCWETIQGKGAAGYPEGNKRLALLGDALIRSELAQRWFQTEQTTGKSRLEKPLPTRILLSCGKLTSSRGC
jgi:hypothetical protein